MSNYNLTKLSLKTNKNTLYFYIDQINKKNYKNKLIFFKFYEESQIYFTKLFIICFKEFKLLITTCAVACVKHQLREPLNLYIPTSIKFNYY